MRRAPALLVVGLAGCGRFGFPGEPPPSDGSPADAAEVRDAAARTPPSDYAARFRFDEGAGTLTGADGPASAKGTLVAGANWLPGLHGTAITFDPGTSGSVDIASSPALQLKGSMTLSIWYYLVAAARDCGTLAIHGATPATGAAGNTLYSVSLTPPNVTWFQEHGDQQGVATAIPVAQTAFSVRTWHHLAAVRRLDPVSGAAADLIIYLDGVAMPAARIDVPSDGAVGALRLGRDIDAGNPCATPIPALVDELYVYPRALTAAEVALLAAP